MKVENNSNLETNSSEKVVLSDGKVIALKYVFPIIALMISVFIFLNDKSNLKFALIVLLIGIIYWFFELTSEKEIFYKGEKLFVKHKKKVIEIELEQIDNIKISGWPFFKGEIYLKDNTELGDRIYFTVNNFNSRITQNAKTVIEIIRNKIDLE